MGNILHVKVLMTLVLVLLLAGCAAGQGGAGRTLAEEETTANGTEETTVQKRLGNLNRPPDSTLSYGGQEVKALQGTYCWGNTCADAAGISVPSKQKTLTVPSGSEMVFHFGGQSSAYKVERATAYPINTINNWGQAGPRSSRHPLETHGSGIERVIPADLPSGEYALEVFVREQRNDASYYFRIMVE